MKFPLSMLKKFLATDASLDTIAATLTAIGLEVESVEDKSQALKPFVVAEIIEAEKHPQADKLRVCKVKAAQGELQVVCGAPNARAGIKVALANVGTIIPTNGMEIRKSAIRGVESQGMLCSARELGLGEDHAGIIELPGNAKIGDSIVDALGLGDPVIDLNVTANRGDCMGVLGVARDLAAAGLGSFTPPKMEPPKGTDETYPVAIEDTDDCPAFHGRIVRGVKNGASPEWMQRALTAAGMRPISTLVDLTNYGTLGFARPSHIYDLAKLKGALTVRRAREGESFLALNGKSYTLSPADCVIADEAGVIGLGGIMGGERTAVDAQTTDILIELALFDPERIAKSGRAHGIDSDARARFERGVDSGALASSDVGLTHAVLNCAGGTAGRPFLAGSIPAPAAPIAFSPKTINALGGTNITGERMLNILLALGFAVKGDKATPPTWRHDVTQPADLAEEVLRIAGYDAIPTVPLPKSPNISSAALNAAQVRAAAVRRTLAARGLHETYGWGFVSEKQAAAFGGQSDALKLLNPISEELSVMRPNLLPHLIAALVHNHARGSADLALFEVGATFQLPSPSRGGPGRGAMGEAMPDSEPPHPSSPAWGEEIQRAVAAGVRTGLRSGLHWSAKGDAGAFDAKADAFAALDAAGLDAGKTQISRGAPAWYHPGKSGVISLGPKNILGHFGELHPGVLGSLGCDFPVVAFELFLDAIPAAKAAKRKALRISDFQPVRRDFAFVVDATTPASELVKAVAGAEKTLTRDVTIFDVYEGKGVPEGKKSLALSVTLQADDRTLTDAEIEKAAQAVSAAAMKLGAVLR